MAKKIAKIRKIVNAEQTRTSNRKVKVTSVPITVPMTFKGIAEMTGVPSQTISARYHALTAKGKRKIGIPDLIEGYKPRAKRK